MPSRVVVDDDEQIIADLLKRVRRLETRQTTTRPYGTHDEFTVAATPETEFQLTYIPVSGTCAMYNDGAEQEEDTDYTVDYDTGLVTFDTALTTGQRINFRYLITDWLVARSLPEEGGYVTLVDWNETGWRYNETTIADTTDYTSPTFDDSAWSVGQAAFGSGTGPTTRHTNWPIDDRIWIRRTVQAVDEMRITVRIDNFADVWVNGVQVAERTALQGADDGTLEKTPFDVDESILNSSGTNYIAVRADDDTINTGDVSFIDVKIEGVLPAGGSPPTGGFTDDFNRADSSTTLGSPWSAVGTWGINGSQAYVPDTSAALHFATVDAGVGDGLISADVPTFWGSGSNGGWGIVFRFTDANNNYVADFGTASPGLYKIVGGTSTLLHAFGSTMTSGDTIQVALSGTSIICKRVRGGTTTVLANITDSTWTNTKHKHGLYAYGSDLVSRFDNFSVA